MADFTSYFIAIPVPEADKQKLISLRDKLKKLLPTALFVNLDTAHITLYYLKKNAASAISNIADQINTLLTQCDEEIYLTNLNTFSKNNPSVVFVNVKSTAMLENLHQKFEQTFSNYSAADNALSFQPHVTIARLQNEESQQLFQSTINEIEKLTAEFSFPISEIAIYGANSKQEPEHQEKLITIPTIK